jgi:hypothetical protein
MAGVIAQVVECWLSKYETLSSSPSSIKKKIIEIKEYLYKYLNKFKVSTSKQLSELEKNSNK